MFRTVDIKYLLIIFLVAFIYNFSFLFFTGIPLKYQLNGDAEVHVAHWREFSVQEKNIFANDAMFKLDIRPKGELFVDKMLVRIGELLGIDILNWAVVVSAVSLIIFLSGVYFVVARSLNNRLIGLLVGLGSVVPAFSLGGSTWGFHANGFLPRDLALGFAVWLLLFYFRGIKQNSVWLIRIVFLVSGLLANWYPLLFLHYILVLILADIIRSKSIKLEHFFYGLLFGAGAIFAVYDVIAKSISFTPINLELFRARFSYLLLDPWDYAIFRYLRRLILYTIIVGGFYYIAKKIVPKNETPVLRPWYAIWLSAGILSVVGLYLENYTAWARFFLSRTSIWFLFASMAIVAYIILSLSGQNSTRLKIFRSKYFGLLIILLIFLGQSMLPTSYRYIRDLRQDASNYLKRVTVIEKLRELTAPGSVILMDSSQAGKIRTYGSRISYVSWKDGNITVLDGKLSAEWNQRLGESDQVLGSGDFGKIKEFSRQHNISYFLYNENDITKGKNDLKNNTIFEYKPFGIAKISAS